MKNVLTVLTALTFLALPLSFTQAKTSDTRPGGSGLFASKLLYSSMIAALKIEGRLDEPRPKSTFYSFEEMSNIEFLSILRGEEIQSNVDLVRLSHNLSGLGEVIAYLVTITDGQISTKEAFDAIMKNATVYDIAVALEQELDMNLLLNAPTSEER